jgi:hypothetical protein
MTIASKALTEYTDNPDDYTDCHDCFAYIDHPFHREAMANRDGSYSYVFSDESALLFQQGEWVEAEWDKESDEVLAILM